MELTRLVIFVCFFLAAMGEKLEFKFKLAGKGSQCFLEYVGESQQAIFELKTEVGHISMKVTDPKG